MGDAAGHDPRSRILQEFVERLAPERPGSTARLDRATVEIFEAFAAARVDALLLKGPALERALYRDGERRMYVDIDLLVAPKQRDAARAALAALRYIDASAPLGIDDIGGVVHAETWAGGPHTERWGLIIELHLWWAGSQADPAVAWEALNAARESIELDGRPVAVLSRAGLAMNLATHAAQHGPEYSKGIAELELSLERWPPAVWEQAAALAAELEATDAFAAGLRLVAEGERMAAALGLPASDRDDWTIRNRGIRPRGTFHLRAFADAATSAERLDIVRRALLPKREWIRNEHRWARTGELRLVAAYAVHLVTAPIWVLRAWRFRRREPR